MGKMLFINLSDGSFHEEEITEKLAREYIGGYGIGARILTERMKPGCDPLGPGNILGIGTGPLTNTGAMSTCRFTTMGKSPLTGFWGDANSGGDFANALKASGFDIVFFEGKSDQPVYLLVRNGKVELKDARHLWGKDSVETETLIRSENGDPKLKIACIGPAGEKCSRIAAIMNAGGRAAARSGLGAVMGSKNVKALVCGGSLKPMVFDKKRLSALMKTMMAEVKNNPSPMFQILNKFGTAGAMVPHLAVHAVPIKNWAGNNIEDFPESKWAQVGWDGLKQYVTKKYACTGCPIACGDILTIPEGKYAVRNAHKPEYESLAAFGPNCMNDNMDSLVYANDLCNLYGLDTISAGATIAFAVECFEKDILTTRDTDGLELHWGNHDAIITLLKKMGTREGIGDILADGARAAAIRIGRGSEAFVMDVGGELLPMHDPRETPGWGAAYIADPTPARHTRNGTQMAESGMANPVVMEGLGLPLTMERYNHTGKGIAHAKIRAWQHFTNTSGICLFASDGMPYLMVEVMNAVTGWNLTYDEVVKTGFRISSLLQAFNTREGFTPSQFAMPPRVEGKPQFTIGAFKGLTLDYEELKKQYYEAMGFDYETGTVGKERIEALNLTDILYKAFNHE